LIVTIPKTPRGDDVLGVEAEVKYISNVVKDLYTVQSLRHPNADTVLDKLKDFSIVHFAYYGSLDFIDLLDSFLTLLGNSNSVPNKPSVLKISNANLE
jgi:CHAT domain-containing protein